MTTVFWYFFRSFTNLGFITNFELSNTEDIKARVKKASKAIGALNFTWQTNEVMFKAKSNIYKAIVMNLLLWRYNDWNGNKTDMEIIECFHTKSFDESWR